MNTNAMFSSKTDMWETPQDFFDKMNKEFHFTLDACATPENAKCERFFTKEQDGLAQLWDVATSARIGVESLGKNMPLVLCVMELCVLPIIVKILFIRSNKYDFL